LTDPWDSTNVVRTQKSGPALGPTQPRIDKWTFSKFPSLPYIGIENVDFKA
jgi:hypothetical protein